MSYADFSNGCAWINGDYMPIDQAMIPITESGFTRSDVTYDVVAVWDGKFFRVDDHLDRFERAWKQLRMTPAISKGEIRNVLFNCVAKSGIQNAYVEMIMTRGVAPLGVRDPRQYTNRFYAFAIPYVWIAQPDEQERGIDLVVAKDVVRTSPESIDPTVKNFQWGDLVRGMFEAYDQNAQAAVLLNSAGDVTEGPGFNIFIFRDGRLLTPESGVLLGITRRTVLEIAEEQGIDTEIGKFGLEELQTADEIFLTSTAGGVVPVASLDGKAVSGGKPGALTMMLRELYWQAHDNPKWTDTVNYDSSVRTMPIAS